MKKNHDASFKAKVALEAVKGVKTITKIASEYGVHPNQIGQWKKRLLEELPALFSDRRRKEKEGTAETDELYRQIGQLKVELDWLKKNIRSPANEKSALIEPGNPDIPVSRQCRLPGLSSAACYYRARERGRLNSALMRLLDEQYTKTPFYGVPRMTEWLRTLGHRVNRKRVRRLMRLMGLEAVYPKPWLSKPAKEHKKHPYLLRDLEVGRPDQVWSADITYIRLVLSTLWP